MPYRMTLSLLLVGACTTLNSTLGQEPRTASTPIQSDPVFEVVRLDGRRHEGRLESLAIDDVLTLHADDGPVEIPIAETYSITRNDLRSQEWTAGERNLIAFPDGDRLYAIIGMQQEQTIRVLPAILEDEPIALPVDRFLGAILTPPKEPDERAALLRSLTDDPRDTDVVWLANGDRQSGLITKIGSEAISIETDAGDFTLPRTTIRAFGHDPALITYPAPPVPYLEVSFVDGSRLGLSSPKIDRGRLIGTTRFGIEIQPALSSIRRMLVRSPSVVFLSDREARASEFVGYLGEHPGTYGRGQTWDRQPLRLDGWTYDRGLGTLPRTLLAYVLEPGVRRFQATIGLDDRAGERGSVVYRVLVDNQTRFVSDVMTRHVDPVFVDVDLTGGRVLILVTEFGESGDVQDSADWIEARLIR